MGTADSFGGWLGEVLWGRGGVVDVFDGLPTVCCVSQCDT